MYVCMSITLRNANFGTLRTRLPSVRGVRMWPHYCRERRIEHKEVLNGADAMECSISTEDGDQRRRRLDTLSLRHSSPRVTLTSNTRRSLPLHPSLHVRIREALLHIRLPS